MKIKTRVCCILCTFLVGMPFTACMHDNKGSSGTDGISLSSVQQKVKDALGDDYVPDQSLDDAALEQLYGIKAEDLEEYSAEISSMSAHVDQFAAFKAKRTGPTLLNRHCGITENGWLKTQCSTLPISQKSMRQRCFATGSTYFL